MAKIQRFVGLDVHAETIAVAVAEGGGEARTLGRVANRPEAVRKLIKRLGERRTLRVCYEAGPTGYGLYWQLTKLGVKCEVVAPTLVPSRPGDRVKTDRRDAVRLARAYRAGDLTPVWVPDEAHEALRDVVRAREAAKKDELRARHRLSKFLLRQGRRPPEGVRTWTVKFHAWLETVTFEQPAQQATLRDYQAELEHQKLRVARLDAAIDEAIQAAPVQMQAVIAALQTLRGVAKVTAVAVVAEVGRFSRFAKPRQLMGYSGMVPSEHSSGARTRRRGITKTGNAHLRRVGVEAGWAYRHRPAVKGTLRARQQGQPQEVCALAIKAQHRLCGRYRRLTASGKLPQQVVTAIGRELLGFMWAIGCLVEQQCGDPMAAAA